DIQRVVSRYQAGGQVDRRMLRDSTGTGLQPGSSGASRRPLHHARRGAPGPTVIRAVTAACGHSRRRREYALDHLHKAQANKSLTRYFPVRFCSYVKGPSRPRLPAAKRRYREAAVGTERSRRPRAVPGAAAAVFLGGMRAGAGQPGGAVTQAGAPVTQARTAVTAGTITTVAGGVGGPAKATTV